MLQSDHHGCNSGARKLLEGEQFPHVHREGNSTLSRAGQPSSACWAQWQQDGGLWLTSIFLLL